MIRTTYYYLSSPGFSLTPLKSEVPVIVRWQNDSLPNVFLRLYSMEEPICTGGNSMEIGIAALRADLKRWINKARTGEEVIVTDRGVAVARLVGVDATPILERLEQEGVLHLPRTSMRPKATGTARIPTSLSVSDLVSEQRG